MPLLTTSMLNYPPTLRTQNHWIWRVHNHKRLVKWERILGRRNRLKPFWCQRIFSFILDRQQLQPINSLNPPQSKIRFIRTERWICMGKDIKREVRSASIKRVLYLTWIDFNPQSIQFKIMRALPSGILLQAQSFSQRIISWGKRLHLPKRNSNGSICKSSWANKLLEKKTRGQPQQSKTYRIVMHKSLLLLEDLWRQVENSKPTIKNGLNSIHRKMSRLITWTPCQAKWVWCPREKDSQ